MEYTISKALVLTSSTDLQQRFSSLIQSMQLGGVLPFAHIEQGLTWITDPADFLDDHNEIKPSLLQGIDAIFLQAELTWNNHARTHFYGLELVRKIRLARRKLPLFLCSLLPKDDLYTEAALAAAVLKTPGHYYVSMQSGIIDLKAERVIRPLTDKLLQDIIESCFDLKGRVQEIFHNFKNQCRQDEEAAIRNCFSNLLAAFGDSKRIILADIEARLRGDWEAYQGRLSLLLGKYREEIIALVPGNGSSPKPIPQKQPLWTALFVDDDAHARDAVSKWLTDAGIHCITADTGERAIEILAQDALGKLGKAIGEDKVYPANSICVLICDWRMQNEKEEWQYYQGQDIIDHIHGLGQNTCAYFLLTSKRDRLIQEAQKEQSERIFPYYKGEVMEFEDARFGFIEKIRLEGDRVLDANQSQPRLGGWLKAIKGRNNHPLKDYYREFRASPRYAEYERWISSQALAFMQDALLVRQGELVAIPKSYKLELTSTLKHGPKDPEDFEKFLRKLIGRRIIIGLHVSEDLWGNEEIINILKEGRIDEDYEPEQPSQLFTANLCLPLELDKDIPDHLLVEERAWLQNELGIIFGKDERFFKFVETFVRRCITKFSNSRDERGRRFFKPGEADIFFDHEDGSIQTPDLILTLLTEAHRLSKRDRALEEWFERQLRKFLRYSPIKNQLVRYRLFDPLSQLVP